MATPVLGYWDIRGLAQPIRYLLVYCGVKFEDKYYQLRQNNDRSEWFDVKFTLGLDFPNLPYYFDGDVKLTHSLTILQYLGRKYNLVGKTEQELIRISMIEQQVLDLIRQMNLVAYNLDFKSKKDEFLQTLPSSLKLISDFLGEQKFVTGDNLTYADFWLYEYLVKVKVMVPEVFGQFERFSKFVDRIESLPVLSEHIKSLPAKTFNNGNAWWNASL